MVQQMRPPAAPTRAPDSYSGGPSGSDLYQCRPGPIAPLCKIGQNMLVLHDGKWRLYLTTYMEGIPISNAILYNAGALAAAGTVAQANLTAVLDMNDLELFQFRMRVLDDVQLTIWQQLGNSRELLGNVIGTITAYSHLEDECDHLTEKAIYYNRRIYMTTLNPTQYAIAQARTIFYGFRYQLEEMAAYDNIRAAMASGHKWTAVVGQGAGTRQGVSFG